MNIHVTEMSFDIDGCVYSQTYVDLINFDKLTKLR